MRKSDIVKLVFVILLTLAAIYCCLAAISVRVGLEQTRDNVNGNKDVGYALGFAFAAAFGYLIAVLVAFAGIIANAISILLCAFGLRSLVGWMKITFLVSMILNFILIAVTAIGTFAGL